MSVLIKKAAEHWEFVSPLLRKPKNEDDYDTAGAGARRVARDDRR